MKKLFATFVLSICFLCGSSLFARYLNACELSDWYYSHYEIYKNSNPELAHACLVNASIFEQKCEGMAME